MYNVSLKSKSYGGKHILDEQRQNHLLLVDVLYTNICQTGTIRMAAFFPGLLGMR